MQKQGKTKNVLVVDDNAIIRGLVRAQFESDGFDSCIEAANGDEAIRLAREHRPSLIILDFAMPGMTGIQVAPILYCENFFLTLPSFSSLFYGDTVKHMNLKALGITAKFSQTDSLAELLRKAHELTEQM